MCWGKRQGAYEGKFVGKGGSGSGRLAAEFLWIKDVWDDERMVGCDARACVWRGREELGESGER